MCSRGRPTSYSMHRPAKTQDSDLPIEFSYLIFNSPKTLLVTFWPYLGYLYSRFTPRCLLSLHDIPLANPRFFDSRNDEERSTPDSRKVAQFFRCIIAEHGTKSKKRKELKMCKDRLEQMVVLSCTSRAEGLFHSLTNIPVVKSLDLIIHAKA